MKRTIFALVPMLVLLSGCLPLDFPLSDPMLASRDSDLCGVWQREGKNDEFIFVGIEKGEDGTPQGLMQFCNVGYNGDTQEMSAQTYEFFVTELKGATYGNILFGGQHLSKKADYEAWSRENPHKVGMVKYHVAAGVLTIWTGDDKAFDALKKDQKIDSAPALIGYLKEHGDSEIFPDSSKLTYHKFH